MAATSPALIKKATSLLKQQGGLVRFTDALQLGIHRDTLRKLQDTGVLERVSRGLYRLSAAEPMSSPDLAIVSKRVPGAVICLVSALAYHELTTQIPHEVHIAIANNRRPPRLEHPPIQVYKWETKALQEGVETHVLDGVEVRITNPERSVADAFRYRNRLGVDLAVEALRAWRDRRGARPDNLLKAARVVHVEKVVQPYLQAVL